METMTESGGVIPHHHHSNFFPPKEASSTSFFFPSNAGNQSVYRGYGSGGGQGGDSGTDIGYGGQQQHKGHERRDSEERGGGGGGGRGGDGAGESRRNSSGIGGGMMVPPGVGTRGGGDRYYLPSSQSSHHPQQHPLTSSSASSYHPHNHHQFQKQQQSPHRGINQFFQHQQHQRIDDDKKLSEGLHSVGAGGDSGRSNDLSSSSATFSPEKRPLGKDGVGNNNMIGEFSPKKGMGVSYPYDSNSRIPPYYYNSNSKHGGIGRHQTGFMNENNKHSMPGFMADVRESVKEVYDSFMQSRGGGGNSKDETESGGKVPEAVPIAYDENDIYSQQHYREKLERSTSQDAAAALAARNIMPNREYNNHLYEGGDHQRPRATTMNSMYNRKDNPSSLHQNSPYGTSNKNHDLYNKMRDHFNRSEAALKNHYYFADNEKEPASGANLPMSPSSPYLGKHHRRPSGDRSSAHGQSRQESSVNRMMMMMSPNNQSDHRQLYPPMRQHQHHNQHIQPHPRHHLFQQQQSDVESHQNNRSTNALLSHPSSQRKSLDSGGEEDTRHSSSLPKTNPGNGEPLAPPRSPFDSSSSGNTRKSPMISESGDPISQKQRPPSVPASNDQGQQESTSCKKEQLSGDDPSSITQSKTSDKDKDDIEAKVSPSAVTSPNVDIDKEGQESKNDDTEVYNFVSSNSDGTEDEPGTRKERPSTPINDTSTTPKLDSSSNSPKADEDDSLPHGSFSRKLSRDSSDDTSLPDALPRELMPKKEYLSDGEDDSFLGSSANYPPMTPPSPNSSTGMNVYPSSFPHHQQPLPPHHPHHRQQPPFFHSPDGLPAQMSQPNPFGSPRGLQDGHPAMPPTFPFNKDIPSRFPMPGLPRDLPLGPTGPHFMGGPIPPLNMGGEKDVYFCHLCSYSGKSKSDFDNHMGIHFEYNCPHCDYTSRTEGRLKRHIKDFHTDENGRRSMPGRPKVFKCKQCSFSATEKDKFWEHARSHIKEDKLLQCPKCPFVTEYKHHLEYHLRNHFGSKPFKCNKCNYSCVNKSMLNSHMKSHTNVYQYRCSDCTYATKYCHSLKLHLRKYNHKPATVLNQDGSLPQGADAEASGLSVNTKRGPPRGPRGPRKDKHDPYFNPMFGGMPPMPMGLPPGMNPMLKGMMPFWPMMPPSGLPGHPGMMPGLPNMPQHMGMRATGDRDNMDMRSGGERIDPEMNGMMSGENSPIKDDDDIMYLPCRLCDYVADGTEALCLHLLQAHKDETGEMASMYGISESALAESLERAKKIKLDRAEQRMDMRISEMSNESEHEMSEFRRSNSIAGLLSRDNPNFVRMNGGDKPFWASGFEQREKTGIDDSRIQDLCYVDDGNDDGDNENDSAGGMDILQQMTLKFGGGVGTLHAGRSKSLDAELVRSLDEDRDRDNRNEDDVLNSRSKDRRPHGHKESPLDLTKPKSASPSIFSNPSSPRRYDEFNSDDDEMRPMWMESGRGSELDKVTENLARKRLFSEAEDINPGEHSAIPTQNQDASTIVPRKRSRKGKAYKLETLCLKLQERQSNSPNDSDDPDSENEFNNMEQYQGSMLKLNNENQDEDDIEKGREDVEEKCDTDKIKKDIEDSKETEECYSGLKMDKQRIDDDTVDQKKEMNNEMKEKEDDLVNDKTAKKENFEMVENDAENKEEDTGDKLNEENDNENIEKEVDLSREVKTEHESNEADNSFEKLQEALKDLNKEIIEEETEEENIKLIDHEPASSLPSDDDKIYGEDKEKSTPINLNDISDSDGQNNGESNFVDDDDDDDAKTEILGEDLTTKDNLFDLSDKENSNDGYGGFENSNSSDKTPTDEVQIEDKVDMINTVLENRKKPLPPAVRRGTELAWKLLNDPVNPVTSIPIPVVSPPPPEWKTSSQQQPQPSSPMTSQMGSNTSGISAIPSPHAQLTGNMGSPLRNGIRLPNQPQPFNQGGLPPSPSINLNMKPHMPIPLPPTPMAFIPPTNRMMPEHTMPRPHPPPPQGPLHPSIPMNKPVPKDMYECTYCDLSFRDCVMYTVHMGYHSNRNPFKCNSCGIICRDKVEFFLHIARSPHS